jgi:saccharopine dehydrogenase (NAD+, L-lysine-forming)
MRIGIIAETKSPPDRRVPFTPKQLVKLKSAYPDHPIVVQSSPIRCFADKEYEDAAIKVRRDVSDCEVLFGVKEVETGHLIRGKTYFFFSHTAKEQPYNRGLLKEIASRKITLVDYEYLTNHLHIRLVAFGRWAGVVGAYNGLRAYGERYRQFRLKPAHDCRDLEQMKAELGKVTLQPIKVLVTGGGRVAGGAMETLGSLGLEEVLPEAFLGQSFEEPVVCRIDPWDYVRRKDGEAVTLEHFFRNPEVYESIFKPYTKVTDLFIACHFWDPKSPVFMTTTDMREPDFHIRVIADVSCDINGPIPSTIRSSTIADPFYGYDPMTESETPPFDLRSITVMAVDNLPGELPRDASEDFGDMLLEKVVPSLIEGDREGIIRRATIVRAGELGADFKYLVNYLEGR